MDQEIILPPSRYNGTGTFSLYHTSLKDSGGLQCPSFKVVVFLLININFDPNEMIIDEIGFLQS